MAGSKPGVSKRKGPTSPRGPNAIRDLQRDNEALTMRANGVNLRDIAEHFGYKHPMEAARMVDRAMARVPRENAIKLRAVWDERHDLAARRLIQVLEEDHVAISNGNVVMYDGRPVHDRMPWVAAAKALMDVSKRAAAMGGIDPPTRKVVETVSSDIWAKKLAELEAELGANDGVGSREATAGDSSAYPRAGGAEAN